MTSRNTAPAPARPTGPRLYRMALLNPNTSEAATELMLASARRALPPNSSIEGHTAPFGEPFITTPAALQASALMMNAFAQGVACGDVQALIVSGFGDPGLQALQRNHTIPVTGLAEASIREAALGGRRFSIVTVTPDLHDSLLLAAQTHGQAGELASIRFTQGAVRDAMDSPEALQHALLLACQRAIEEDGAQVIVIGGGPLAQAAPTIARQLATEVIDPVAAAVRLSYQRCQHAQGRTAEKPPLVGSV